MTAARQPDDERIDRIERVVGGAFSEVLGDRFVALASHGSAVTGGYIPGFSDLDFVLLLRGELVEPDAIELQSRLGSLDAAPFAYLQLSRALTVDAGQPLLPSLVPGAYRVIAGALPGDDVLHTEETLRASGRSWLARLPEAVSVSVIDWAVDTGNARRRRIRLMMTALKPAVRALLVEPGSPSCQPGSRRTRDSRRSGRCTTRRPVAASRRSSVRCHQPTARRLPSAPNCSPSSGWRSRRRGDAGCVERTFVRASNPLSRWTAACGPHVLRQAQHGREWDGLRDIAVSPERTRSAS